jgi:hypothetical protein
MNRGRRLSGVAVLSLTVLIVAGCVTPAQFLDSKQGMAVKTAVTRGQFELACPTATGEVLSREVIQPVMVGPWVGGVQRGEYTVGVSGCDKRIVFTVICPDGGEGCFATGPGR